MLAVAKFGGSILRGGEGYRVSASEAARLRERYQLVVVVSAMKGVTDELLELCESPGTWPPRLEALMKRHYNAASEALGGAGGDSLVKSLGELSRLFDELVKLVWAVNVMGGATPSAKAAIMAFGERLSAVIMAYALRARGLKAEWFDAGRAGIVGSGNPLEATVDYEASRERVRRSLTPVIKSGAVPVVTGFTAESREGKTLLLGRGGGDYTATLLASFLDADEVYLYTDVPGVMTADPRRISGARVIPALSYEEAMELALLGAKRFHPRTFEPLLGTGIRVVIGMPGSRKATVVDEKGGSPPLKSVVITEDLALVTVVGGSMVGRIGTAARVTGAAASLGVNIIAIMQPITETSISLAVARRDADRLSENLSETIRGVIREVRVEDVSAVSVIGEGVRDPGIAGPLISLATRGGRVKSVLWAPPSPTLVVFTEPGFEGELAERLHREVLSYYNSSKG